MGPVAARITAAMEAARPAISIKGIFSSEVVMEMTVVEQCSRSRTRGSLRCDCKRWGALECMGKH